MFDETAQVGKVVASNTEDLGSQWLATGFTMDLGGQMLELSVLADSKDSALEALDIKAWSAVFASTKYVLTEHSTVLELVDLTIDALRRGDAGRGNRIQTINTYERHRAFLTGERPFPPLGNVSLQACTVHAVHSWLELVAREHPASGRHLKILLTHAFDIAIRQEIDLWKDNPARTARLPMVKHSEPVEITEEEFSELLQRAREWEASGKRTDMIGILCCYMATGIRPGELPALLWEEVDLETEPATMIISGCAVLQDYKQVRQSSPKTEAGFREITIPKWFKELLLVRYANLNPKSPYVFPSNTGTMLNIHNIGNRFREVRGEKLKHIKLKSFRSTVATRIDREKGAEEAARHLGHTSPAITGRHYIKRARKTGDNSAILAAFDPGFVAVEKDSPATAA